MVTAALPHCRANVNVMSGDYGDPAALVVSPDQYLNGLSIPHVKDIGPDPTVAVDAAMLVGLYPALCKASLIG